MKFCKILYWDPYYFIFIEKTFFVIEQSDFCYFAGNNTLYSCEANLETVLENLENKL